MKNFFKWILKASLPCLIFGMFVCGFIEEAKSPDLEFIIFSGFWIVIILYFIGFGIYDRLYGAAKNATKFIDKNLHEVAEEYHRLFHSLKILHAQLYYPNEPQLAIEHVKTICESLENIKEWYADKSLDKYITEEERTMKFKKIDKEIQRLNSLVDSLEYSFFNKTSSASEKIEQHRINKVAKALANELNENSHIAYFNVKIEDYKPKGTNKHEYTLPAEVLITTQSDIRTTENKKLSIGDITETYYRILRVFFPKGGYKRFSHKNNYFLPGRTNILTRVDEDGKEFEQYVIYLSDQLTENEIIQERIISKLESDFKKLEAKYEKVKKKVDSLNKTIKD